MMILAETASANSATATTVVAVLAALGVGSVVTAVVTGLFSKRKLGAEATEIITNAASSVVKTLENQLARSERQCREDQVKHERQMNEMATAHIRERDEWRKVLQLHVAWDALAISKLAELHLQMPPTPPLTPAQRFVDDQGYPLGGVD